VVVALLASYMMFVCLCTGRGGVHFKEVLNSVMMSVNETKAFCLEQLIFQRLTLPITGLNPLMLNGRTLTQ